MTSLNKEQLKSEIYKLNRYHVTNDNPISKLLYPAVEAVRLDSVISILDNVEKPIIPQFVADWIEKSHSFGSSLNHDIFNLITDAYDTDADERKLIENYLYDSSDAIETIVDAYRYGFTVEKKQRYEVRCKGELLLTYYTNLGKVVSMNRWVNHLRKEAGRDWKLRHQLTEQEIKEYDERYFAFAVKVEELEE